MKALFLTLPAIALAIPSASAALIAGADFSDAAAFNQAGGVYDIVNTDDLNAADNVTVTNWASVGGGSFVIGGTAPFIDANAQVGMPNDLVSKINGDDVDQPQPAVGTNPTTTGVSFSIIIPASAVVDLTNVTWDWRQSTGTATSVRWLAFKTSLDANLTFSEVGVVRNAFTSEDMDLSGPAYQGLTDTTVTFTWLAGGQGSGDIDFDTVIVNGTVTQVPEPSAFALLGLGALGLLRRRR